MNDPKTNHKGRVCKAWLDWIYDIDNMYINKNVDLWRLMFCPFCGEVLD